MTDPISDMLNRIVNAQAVKHPTVFIPSSRIKHEMAKILEKTGFIEKVEKKGRKTKRFFEITLKYQDGTPAISGAKRVSRPGQRIYLPAKEIKLVKGGFGIAIISTSQGLITNKEAKKRKLGGEIICEIW